MKSGILKSGFFLRIFVEWVGWDEGKKLHMEGFKRVLWKDSSTA